MARFVRRTAVASALASTLWMGAAPPAYAQSNNRAAAEALFRDARQLLEEGKYAEACEKLAASQRLDPAVGTLLNLARCYEKNGQTASAWATYRDAVAQAKQAGQAEREKSARKAAEALEGSLSRLTITVSPDVGASGTQVTRDGVPVPSELWGVNVPVDPGEHAIAVNAPGKKPWTIKITVETKATKTLAVPALEAAPSDAPAGGAVAGPENQPARSSLLADTPPSVSTSSWNTQKTVGVVLMGVGVAGGVVAIVEGLRFTSKKDDADKLCPTDRCDAGPLAVALEDRRQATNARTLGEVVGVVSGAALIGGAIVFFTAGSGSASQGKVGLHPVVGRETLGLSMNATW